MTVQWRVGLWLLVVVAPCWFLWLVRGVLPPFLLALLCSMLLEPVVRWLGKRGLPRPVGVLTITVVFFGLIGIVAALLAPRVGDQVNEAGQTVQLWAERWSEEAVNDNVLVRWNPVVRAQPPGPLATVDKLIEQARPMLTQANLPTSRHALIDQYVTPHKDDIARSVQGFLNRLVGSVGGAASTLLMLAFTPLLVVMILMDLERLTSTARSWIPPSLRSGTVGIASDIAQVFQRYVQGVLINISMYAVLVSVALTLLNVPYAILLGLVAAVFYLVPILGGWCSALAICTVTGLLGVTENAFFQASNPWAYTAVVFGVFTVINVVWDTFITPRVVGSAVDLHPLVSMFVVFSGGALFGLPGMVLAYPLAGIVKVTLGRLMNVTNAPTEDLRLPAVPPRHRREGEVA
jgi:predicted PurR-regulated permease PerM